MLRRELRRVGVETEPIEQWILRDGYQLCRTCGEAMTTGDRALRQDSQNGFNYWHVNEQTCSANNTMRRALRG